MGKIPAVFIFVFPPGLDELKRRLVERKTESAELIQERLSWSEKEMKVGKLYQYHIVNDEFEKAYQELRGIVMAEVHLEEK